MLCTKTRNKILIIDVKKKSNKFILISIDDSDITNNDDRTILYVYLLLFYRKAWCYLYVRKMKKIYKYLIYLTFFLNLIPRDTKFSKLFSGNIIFKLKNSCYLYIN